MARRRRESPVLARAIVLVALSAASALVFRPPPPALRARGPVGASASPGDDIPKSDRKEKMPVPLDERMPDLPSAAGVSASLAWCTRRDGGSSFFQKR